jgi:predicted AAA+ superfamily ATPase
MAARDFATRLLEALADTPVVFVQGPRQLGKTTLVQNPSRQESAQLPQQKGHRPGSHRRTITVAAGTV